MEKLDTSPEEEAIKDKAREFMSGLVSSAAEVSDAATTSTAEGAQVVKAWKDNFTGSKDVDKFWEIYDDKTTSIWTMVYDEADSNETLEDTIAIVADLLDQPGMVDIQKDCFAVIHTLDTLEIEGLWFFNGPNPEILFGANEETSWFSFSQLGPEATDLVKSAVLQRMIPSDGRLNGKDIKDTKIIL